MNTHARASRSRPARSARASRCRSGICLALRLDRLDQTAQVFCLLSDGDCQEGQTWEGATAASPLRPHQHHRDRRLQPPADRRHHRGGHGHRRRARQVRGLRLGLGRDRRPRHGARSSRRSSAAAPSTGRRRSSARPRRAAASRFMEGRFGFHGKPPSQEQAEEALTELEATLEEQTQGASGEAPMERRRLSRSRPATPTATRSSSSARRTRTSSRSTPTSRSRPSR